ncbi:hypothetical protein DQ04_00311140 [Trypanosoma grayi]|uniref:hypothetical protein n=1 Tax=Trypanosoma grayi TaxID=71804 RepID=UPI0004F4B853|nr:hypothetical protein DQ04_00311140 [Trypanosoma grayi]KEG14778.1 hypothetical protein DQ04_00311140 [Trypanosoma grayi]
MLTAHYNQIGAMYTVSHEVVNRVALQREEDGQCAYHVAKCDYQLAMNRISTRLPPPALPEIKVVEDNEFSTYCSSTMESMSGTKRGDEDDDPGYAEIERELYMRAMKRCEKDAQGGPLWKREVHEPIEVFLHREELARRDIEEVEHEFCRKLTDPFNNHPFMRRLKLVRDERRGRKAIEDVWMSESLPFLEQCSMKQVEFTEAFWRRAFGRLKRAPGTAQTRASQLQSVELDMRLYQPLRHHSDTIRRETESEEEIAFRYLQLGEAAQRDLVARGIMHRNKDTGLLDSVLHPISAVYYEQVDFAFSAEYRYLVSCEETQRMAIIDAALSSLEELRTSMKVT